MTLRLVYSADAQTEGGAARLGALWLQATRMWADYLRRLGRFDAARRVLRLEFIQDFSAQLANERALRETYWALPCDQRNRLEELDRRFGQFSNNLHLPWSSLRRQSWTLEDYAAEAQRTFDRWREELERSL